MTRINKLYANLLANPRAPISFRDFEKLLRAFGFEHVRTTGSHRQYVHPKLHRPLPIQPSAKDAKPYQVREFLELVEEYGLYGVVTEPHYHINLFWSAEDDCWIADVPDLRPCSAHGDTRNEAIANIDDAIAGWLQVAEERGYPIPEPRYRPAIYA